MECEEIKKIIPQYFQHTASEEEIQTVEEHLCVCHDCRTVLGELMDKASSAEEVAEVSTQEQPESLPEEKAKPPLEEEKEEPSKEKTQEEASARGGPASGWEEKKEEEVPVSSEKKEDVEYFPGEGLEASMDKVDDILGKTEPARGDPGSKLEEVEPVAQDEEEEKTELPLEEEKVEEEGEESSFEVILDPIAAPQQELPAESDIEALGIKDLEPVKEETKEPEVKAELPLEEERIEEKAELPIEKEKVKEKVVFSFEEEKIEEKEEIKEVEEVSEFSSGTGIELKKEESEELAPKEEDDMVFLKEGGENQESLDDVSYSLDGAPLEKGNTGLLEYVCLVAGLGILGFLAYLLLKG